MSTSNLLDRRSKHSADIEHTTVRAFSAVWTFDFLISIASISLSTFPIVRDRVNFHLESCLAVAASSLVVSVMFLSAAAEIMLIVRCALYSNLRNAHVFTRPRWGNHFTGRTKKKNVPSIDTNRYLRGRHLKPSNRLFEQLLVVFAPLGKRRIVFLRHFSVVFAAT